MWFLSMSSVDNVMFQHPKVRHISFSFPLFSSSSVPHLVQVDQFLLVLSVVFLSTFPPPLSRLNMQFIIPTGSLFQVKRTLINNYAKSNPIKKTLPGELRCMTDHPPPPSLAPLPPSTHVYPGAPLFSCHPISLRGFVQLWLLIWDYTLAISVFHVCAN